MDSENVTGQVDAIYIIEHYTLQKMNILMTVTQMRMLNIISLMHH